MAGSKVLLVDLDPQGNATSGLGIDRNAVKLSTYDVLLDGMPVIEAVVRRKVENLAMLPATLDLAGADMELMAQNFARNVSAAGAGTRPRLLRHHLD